MSFLAEALASDRTNGTFRSLQSSSVGLLDFSSNDYLGFSRDPLIRERLMEALRDDCPLGSTGSRLLRGQTEFHERVEAFLAETFRAPSALLFSSGYLANLGVLSSFAPLGVDFFSDELNHASLIDGMRSARGTRHVFRHNDVEDLAARMAMSTAPEKVIVTESVFSQDGDRAPLGKILELARRANAWLIVDEAHATGCWGSRGLGGLEDLALDHDRLIAIHTGGKALGAQGAFVLSSRDVREFLINHARTFIFSTALSPLSALQIEFAVGRLIEATESRRRLSHWASDVRSRLGALGLSVGGDSPIMPILLGGNEKVLRAQSRLRDKGLDIRAIRSPTVAKGSERLRVTLKSFHDESAIDALIGGLGEWA